MEYLFKCSTCYLMSESSERVRYRAREYKLRWPIKDMPHLFYRAITDKLLRDKWKIIARLFIIYRAINGNHVRSRNRLSCTLFPWTTMVATVEEVCFEVIVHFIYIKRYHLAVLCNTSTTHSSVNQYSKPWFCGILRDTFRDGCQCLRTRVDYLIRLVSLITVNSAANNFFRFAVAILFLLTSKHTSSIVAAIVVHGNNVRDSRLRNPTCFPFIAR